MLTATAQSINGVFLNMGKQLDQCQTMKDAEAFGVHQGHELANGTFLPLQQQPSAILGTNSVAPLTMAAAYAGIANGGVFCAADRDRLSRDHPEGKTLPGQPKTCTSGARPGHRRRSRVRHAGRVQGRYRKRRTSDRRQRSR